MGAVSVVGLGKLGAPIAACFASRGFHVVGVDGDVAKVEQLNRGVAPVHETGLPELLGQSDGRLRATTSLAEAIAETDTTFVIVPTPSDASGGFALEYVRRAIDEIGTALREKRSYHLVALTSTVLPGASETVVKPLLEATSGKRCGPDFGLCYSPEFVALGSVIRDFLEPDFLLIGESDRAAGEALERVYRAVCRTAPPVARMGFANAELAKLAVNTYVTTKISFANMLASLCEKIPGADVDAVTSALGLDKRIGPHYLKGSLPYGGPCFPRDNVALVHLGESLGAPAAIAEATDAYNRTLLERLAECVAREAPTGRPIAILGLAYKPGTTVLDEAPGMLLARALARSGRDVVVHDPFALEAARAQLGSIVGYAETWHEALRNAGAVVLMNVESVYREITADDLVGSDTTVVVDPWRAFRGEFEDSPHVRYVGIGLGPERGGLAERQAERVAPQRRVVQPA